jgi:hypothetical protein
MSGNPHHAHSDKSAYKRALQIIRDAAARSDTHIKLSFWGLTSLPPEIGELKNLTRLDLTASLLTSLAPSPGRTSTQQARVPSGGTLLTARRY